MKNFSNVLKIDFEKKEKSIVNQACCNNLENVFLLSLPCFTIALLFTNLLVLQGCDW
ncbi:hypothetical protein NAB59_000116 [Listeria innocua]|nr:hypothetical protein [Listeria innocua]